MATTAGASAADNDASSPVGFVTRSVSQVDLGSLTQKEYDVTEGGVHLRRERTVLEREVIARHDAAEDLIKQRCETILPASTFPRC